MVLTKEELISTLQLEGRILVHLAGKVDRGRLDYRPTPKQRSTLELLQYLAIMGPVQVRLIRAGEFSRTAFGAAWTPAEAAAKVMSFEDAVAAIAGLSEYYTRELGQWSDTDFRQEFDFFGNPMSRGLLLIQMLLSAHAAYRMQLFCYLKSCGREELSTINLWGGVDAPSGDAPPARTARAGKPAPLT
jgi:hypothetical protein